MTNLKNFKDAEVLTRSQLKSINGGTWIVACNDGTEYCPNPNGITKEEIVALCDNHGGFKRQFVSAD